MTTPGSENPAEPMASRWTDPGARVLVVDDDVHDRELMADVLEARGYRVRTCDDGPRALECVSEPVPHVIVLAALLPGMTGFDVCRRLKRAPGTRHIPVVMATDASERRDRVEGMDAGAHDFVHKPVDRHELVLRVGNAVAYTRVVDELERTSEALHELQGLRDGLTRMLVHDMRSPLAAIATNLQLLALSATGVLEDESLEDLGQALASTRALADMVNQILVVSQARDTMLDLDAEEADLRILVREGLDSLKPLARRHRVKVDLPDAPLPLVCDRSLVRRIVSNLFGNAVKYVPAGGSIRVRARATPEGVRVEIEDSGPGIPTDWQEVIFERFVRSPERTNGMVGGESSGLGLAFCKLAAEAHGGRIELESEPGRGSLFRLLLPRSPIQARTAPARAAERGKVLHRTG